MKPLGWWPYLVLLVALVGCLVGFVLLPLPLEGWRAFALNLATEIVGILLVVWLIDAVLRGRERRERERYRSVALGQLWRPLNRQRNLLFNIYKASVKRKPDREISEVADLFDEDYFAQVAWLDITAEGDTLRSVEDEKAMPWFECISRQVERFGNDLGRMVDKYATYLDVDTLDAAERLLGSSFVLIVDAGPIMVANNRHRGNEGPLALFAGHGRDVAVRDYTDAFSALVEIYNREAPTDRQVRITNDLWSESASPKIGSARIPDPDVEETGRSRRDRPTGGAGH
jgi:hypothetical protein